MSEEIQELEEKLKRLDARLDKPKLDTESRSKLLGQRFQLLAKLMDRRRHRI